MSPTELATALRQVAREATPEQICEAADSLSNYRGGQMTREILLALADSFEPKPVTKQEAMRAINAVDSCSRGHEQTARDTLRRFIEQQSEERP